MTDADPVLGAIDDGDVHDQLLGYMTEDETAEAALERLLFALPSFNDLECKGCGKDLSPLDETDWIAWRLQVEDSDHRRTDLFCGLGCLTESIGATLDYPDPDAVEETEA